MMSDKIVNSNPLIIAGTDPTPLVVPASIAELVNAVREARASNQALYPFGGRTMLDLGLLSSKPGIAVDMRQLNQVIDYPARDMTITVQAGITIGKLQEILHAEKQRLPVDIPFPELATLGGAIAANASGPRRFGLGTLRDYVIGISAVNDQGQEIKGGGRVVKNVAGYDLMKLYIGSLGTLGIITQVTLKLKPEPEASKLLLVPVAMAQAAAILDALNATRTRPVCVDLLDPRARQAIRTEHGCALPGDGPAWNLVFGFEDNVKSVAWQAEQIKQELPAELRDSVRECSRLEEEKLWAALRDFCLRPNAKLSFKANLTPGALPDFCRQAATTALLQAHAGNGIVHGHIEDLTLEQARSLLETLGTLAANAKGNLIVTRCPAEWKTILPIWGRTTGDRILMKAIKEKLDPVGIFNPGRFVDGI
jgi:glycolate oxidase FAD binding subunit